ncbi:DNA cytosine methyltransferase [Thalassospira mesophila]|uniref:Cytosine-specific methyltransferase n=1 Tax=Thalassospira mesophila TaxID=1293891 RepID=A0A1Y2L5N4_9PROT|nr:DNA cytosine methyltransferase [Thalassospira mesophila]OSQ39833.1 DNA methyltransferase [Thalassospira mesophila]
MKNSDRPIAIDLFAGAGGMSLGFERAGFDVVAAIEIDPIHAAAHKFNFPECAVIPKSVVGLAADDIRMAAGIGNSEVDVVFGGAPCQGFSMIGQRAIEDPRNQLVKEFVRLVCELNAKSFVFENVKGLTLGKHRKFLEELIIEFQRNGYDVQRQWKVLNAVNFGVPQSRERLFLMGVRSGMVVPEYPTPTHCSPKDKLRPGLCSHVSCSEAISDLPDADQFSELEKSDQVAIYDWDPTNLYAKSMRCLTDDAWANGYLRRWEACVLTSSMRTSHSDISKRRFRETEAGTVEPISRFFKLHPNGVSNTLRAGTDAARGAFTSPRPIHYIHTRCVTVREMARLHSFPDWFRFHGTKWHGARQIGNSVPPLLAEAVAVKIMSALGLEASGAKRVLSLGDPKLLKFDMREASKFWGVAPPISKRNKKSGMQKRKQYEVEADRLVGALK